MKPRYITLVVLLLAIVGSGCVTSSGGGNVDIGGPASLPVPAPESGSTITITNCSGNPEILQVAHGTEVTFVNADSQGHAIGMALPNGVQEISLPAGGNAKFTANSPTGTQVTLNYNCDGAYGGAIFIV